MKKKFTVKAKRPNSVTASRTRNSTKSTTAKRSTSKSINACQIVQDINQYQPWSGAIDTYNNLLNFDCWDAFVDWLDGKYYDETAGEGVISETALNDLLWFEPACCYDAVGLYYNDETGEVSDEPFDNEEDE